MKSLKLIMVCSVLANVLLLTGCQNTLNGMHQDWRSDTQQMSNTANGK